MPALIDLSGQRFGKLTVMKRASISGSVRWDCLCDCGSNHAASSADLRNSHTQSCGCLRRKLAGLLKKSHGLSNDPLYAQLGQIKQRTGNQNNPNWRYYGGRGITLWQPWRDSFELFYFEVLAEIGPRPSPQHTLDRIDNNRGYEPGNLRWALPPVQRRNSLRIRSVTINGLTMCLSDWASRLNLPQSKLNYLIYRKNLTPEHAIEICSSQS